MPSMNHILASGFGLSLTQLARAQMFTLSCNVLVQERADPIVSPGVVASHVHAVVGGTGFNLTEPNIEAVASSGTTCSRPLDHSNYWQPQLYNKNSNGSFQAIEFQGSAVYYLNRACDYAKGRTTCPKNYNATAPPKGLRMVVGNPKLRTFNSSNTAQQAVQHVCLTNGTFAPNYNSLPTQPCLRLRAETFFPSCWDGVNLDSPDHQSHMAFPVQNYNSGVCPESHPKAIYSVFYEFYYNTEPYPQWQNWIWSMGDPTGFGLHGDYLQGWTNQTALEQAVYTCQGPNGFDKAPCSVAVGEGPANRLSPTWPANTENIGLKGIIPALPGNNPVTGAYSDRITPAH